MAKAKMETDPSRIVISFQKVAAPELAETAKFVPRRRLLPLHRRSSSATIPEPQSNSAKRNHNVVTERIDVLQTERLRK